MQFEKGDILKADNNSRDKGYHPIVFLEGNSDEDFIGAMLTHSAYKERNVIMDQIHFIKELEFVFDKTHLVLGKFIKPQEWGPFTKTGKLSEEGIDFVCKMIGDIPSESFNEYFERLK